MSGLDYMPVWQSAPCISVYQGRYGMYSPGQDLQPVDLNEEFASTVSKQIQNSFSQTLTGEELKRYTCLETINADSFLCFKKLYSKL